MHGQSPPPLRALWHGKGSTVKHFYSHKKTPRRCSSSRYPARCSRCNTARPRCDRCSRCRPQAAHALTGRADHRHLCFQSEIKQILRFKKSAGDSRPPIPLAPVPALSRRRKRRADGPVRVTRRVGHVAKPRAREATVVHVAAHKQRTQAAVLVIVIREIGC